MNPALWISKTGLAAQDAKMSAISNNLANVNTTGFKRDRVMFDDLFYQTQRAPGAQLDQNNVAPTGIQYGTGVKIVGTQKEFSVGSMQITKQQMDVAITGQGFFQVETPDGDIAYKVQSINKCIDILNALTSALDYEKGGDLALSLANLYDYCVYRLYDASHKLSVEYIDEVEAILSNLRSGWEEMGKQNG